MSIDPTELIADAEAAEILRQRTQTLAAWRCEKRGPPYVKIGRRIFYRRSDIAEWLGKQLHVPASN